MGAVGDMSIQISMVDKFYFRFVAIKIESRKKNWLFYNDVHEMHLYLSITD